MKGGGGGGEEDDDGALHTVSIDIYISASCAMVGAVAVAVLCCDLPISNPTARTGSPPAASMLRVDSACALTNIALVGAGALAGLTIVAPAVADVALCGAVAFAVGTVFHVCVIVDRIERAEVGSRVSSE
ncbi:hypothetical protein BDW02DRAFT_582389 [Decorospora gaudefroyi]|uniref:Uncharacterized protein n=1 Tax=Decorospora gaudefroyi TaxID=184978 RepID=A0A6A5K8T0_9PLEO|nr:hypothetical protein BDW02DRAFT_582389 [Decorospora gaudefroyi]